MRLILSLLILAELSWAGFPVADDRVVRNAVCVAGGVLYVGGDFSHFGGAERDGVAAIDLAGGQLLDWDPDLGEGHVSAILEMEGLVYLGGNIKDKGFLVAVENGRVLDTWQPMPDKPVAALERGPGNTLYVGGRFSSIAGQPRSMLAQLSSAKHGAAQALPFQPNISDRVTTLVFDGQRLLAGGYFPGLLAAWDARTESPLSLPINIEGTRSKEILRMIPHQGRIYVVGVEISAVAGQPRSNAFALDARTLELAPWRADLDAGAGALSAQGDTVYVGGDFKAVNGQACRLAALDAGTGALQPFELKPDNNTYALQAFEGGVFASGYWKPFSAFIFQNGRPAAPVLLSNLF